MGNLYMNFSRFFKAHEVLNKILKNQYDTIRNSILVTWYSLMELPRSIRVCLIIFDDLMCQKLWKDRYKC